MSIQIGNRREGTDLIQRDYTKGSGSLKGVVSDWKPFTVTWGHMDMDWELTVNGHQVLVDKGALSKLNFYTHAKKEPEKKGSSKLLSWYIRWQMFLLSQDSNVPSMRQSTPHFKSKAGQMIMACLEERTRTSHKILLFYVHLCVNHKTEPLDLLWLGFPGFTLSCDYLYFQKFFQNPRDRQSCWKKLIFSSLWESDFLHCSYHLQVTLYFIHLALIWKDSWYYIEKVALKIWRCPGLVFFLWKNRKKKKSNVKEIIWKLAKS